MYINQNLKYLCFNYKKQLTFFFINMSNYDIKQILIGNYWRQRNLTVFCFNKGFNMQLIIQSI